MPLCAYKYTKGVKAGYRCTVLTRNGEKYCGKHRVPGYGDALQEKYKERIEILENKNKKDNSLESDLYDTYLPKQKKPQRDTQQKPKSKPKPEPEPELESTSEETEEETSSKSSSSSSLDLGNKYKGRIIKKKKTIYEPIESKMKPKVKPKKQETKKINVNEEDDGDEIEEFTESLLQYLENKNIVKADKIAKILIKKGSLTMEQYEALKN